jgi:hypothetical protein
MIRRLRLLETTFLFSDYDTADDGPAASVRTRRMLRLRLEGGSATYERWPSMSFQRNASIAEVLRCGRYEAAHGRVEVAL